MSLLGDCVLQEGGSISEETSALDGYAYKLNITISTCQSIKNKVEKGRVDASAVSLFSCVQVNCQAPPEHCLLND